MRCCRSPNVAAIVNGTPLLDVQFRIKTFNRDILKNDEANALQYEWKPANLFMCDAYGGPTRSVVVHIATTTDKVYLKSIESLPKREFEDLFGFGCGRFEINRVIRVDKAVFFDVELT